MSLGVLRCHLGSRKAARSADRAQCESTMFVGSGIETVILAGFARGIAQSGLSRASPGSTPCGAESRNNFRKEIRDNQS